MQGLLQGYKGLIVISLHKSLKLTLVVVVVIASVEGLMYTHGQLNEGLVAKEYLKSEFGAAKSAPNLIGAFWRKHR